MESFGTLLVHGQSSDSAALADGPWGSLSGMIDSLNDLLCIPCPRLRSLSLTAAEVTITMYTTAARSACFSSERTSSVEAVVLHAAIAHFPRGKIQYKKSQTIHRTRSISRDNRHLYVCAEYTRTGHCGVLHTAHCIIQCLCTTLYNVRTMYVCTRSGSTAGSILQARSWQTPPWTIIGCASELR